MRTIERSPAWLDSLNPQQREAVTHGDGPLLVVAGAGSGKTRTLAYRVAHLVAQGVPPERVLLLTFTRRAAGAMLERAALAVRGGEAIARRAWGGTFHAIGNRLLRIHGRAAGLEPDFTIIDHSDAEDLMDILRHQLGLSKTGGRFPRKGTCLAIYSRRVNGGDDLTTVLRKHFPWCAQWEGELRSLFRAYAERKLEQRVLDYDDLLLYWYHLSQDGPLGDLIGGGFDHILVDEYQDTNVLQAGILAGMRRELRNITVVGDDAQSIYGFRSATPRNMLDFPAQFPGATTVLLEQSYRSTPPILETANRVIGQARERYSKRLWSARTGGQQPELLSCLDENRQDEAVIRHVLKHYEQGIPLRKQAVLFRAASHSASLELALARRGIPFCKYGGLRFLEAGHVKDLLAFLRILENPRDGTAWFRALQLLNGVGPATAAAALGHVAASGHDPASLSTFPAPPAAREEIAGLCALMADLSSTPETAPSVLIDHVRRFYGPLLERRYDDAEARASDLEHLSRLAEGHGSLSQFLADLTLDPPASTGDLAGPPTLDEDWLVLSTIHSTKGLEWDVVFLIHAADGFLPSDMATGAADEIEEELRLTYVALTRARDFLYVSWPLRYYHRPPTASDAHSYAQLCRFFTPEVVESMDQPAPPMPEEAGPSSDPRYASRDIAARIRDLWA